MIKYKTFLVGLFLGLLFSSNLHSQQFNYSFTSKSEKKISGDIVVMPFGNGNPIKVGALSKGKLSINLNEIRFDEVSRNLIEDHLDDITQRLPFPCENYSEDFPKSELAQSGSFVVLNEGLMVAEIYPVTDLELGKWLFSSGHESPMRASYFEVIYADFDADIHNVCTNYLEESYQPYQVHQFDLKLKKGFNLIEFKIEEIGIPSDEPDFEIPLKTLTTTENLQLENIKWVLNPIEES